MRIASESSQSSNAWARVKCPPFRYYQNASHEVGIATPMIIRQPNGIKLENGTLIDWPASITDTYPTGEEVSGTDQARNGD